LLTSVSGANAIVANYALAQNYPNPFNPSTTIEFALPKESRVEIKIYNVLGVQMATLFSGTQTSGYHQVKWDATSFSSGIYFYVMKATSMTDGEKFQSVRRLTLLK
jgi:flagellar hook assembly protein FlgD